MKIKVTWMRLWIILAIMAAAAIATPYQHDCTMSEELRGRSGLPNFFTKARSEKPVRIAYFGGSITAANGWRVKTLAWFSGEFPNTSFQEINAAIGGTGTGFGACRLNTDVLAFQPDLVFVEFRVNGGEGAEKQSVEGIIRQIWKSNPETDICFIYTVSEPMRDTVGAGKNTAFGQVMEQLANYYGIPSIDLGQEVFQKEKEGSLLFKGTAPENGKLLFSNDGVHPTDSGHNLYTQVIIRSLQKMNAGDLHASPHQVKPPLYEQPWEITSLIPIKNISKSAGWDSVDTGTDAVYTDAGKQTDGSLRGALRCKAKEESVTLSWKGTSLGFTDIPHGSPVLIEVVVDGTNTFSFSREQKNLRRKFPRVQWLPPVPDGLHTTTLTVKKLADGDSYYIGQFMQAGPR